MQLNLLFIANSILLGVGLAMDAFSVSLVNGLNNPNMQVNQSAKIAGVFAFFQGFMPTIGWLCVHTILNYFAKLEKMIPWISLILLLYIGGKMLIEGLNKKDNAIESVKISKTTIIIQGVATSIDALSVGFTIAKYSFLMVLICVLIIALVTFIICLLGIKLGKKLGTKLSSKATIVGGIILIFIGIETFFNF